MLMVVTQIAKRVNIISTPTPTPSLPNQLPANSLPVASFTMNTNSGEAPLTVALDASDSNDPDGNIVIYAWQTSDGQSVDGKEIGVTFVNAGTYTITLTVTDNNGESASFDQIVTVNTVPSLPSTATSPATLTGNCTASYMQWQIDCSLCGRPSNHTICRHTDVELQCRNAATAK